MDGRTLRWRAFPGALGLKLKYSDLLEGALGGAHGDFEEHDTLFITFHEAATLICEWFPAPAVAEMQIALLRDLLLYRGTHNKYLLQFESRQPRKCEHDAFIRNLVLPVAENAAKIRAFVQNHHALRQHWLALGSALAQP
jgi:hypothetical protein